MKKIFVLSVVLTAMFAALSFAGDITVEIATAKDKDTEPTDTFEADVAKIYAFFKTTGTKKGDNLRGVWIAEDVGDAAPKNTKIDESSVTADKENFFGAFSLSKPTKGWPVGKYKVEVYAGKDLVETAEFSIEPAERKSPASTGDGDVDSQEEATNR